MHSKNIRHSEHFTYIQPSRASWDEQNPYFHISRNSQYNYGGSTERSDQSQRRQYDSRNDSFQSKETNKNDRPFMTQNQLRPIKTKAPPGRKPLKPISSRKKKTRTNCIIINLIIIGIVTVVGLGVGLIVAFASRLSFY